MPSNGSIKLDTQTTKTDVYKSIAEARGCDDDAAQFEAKLGKFAKAASGETKAHGNIK